MVVDTSAQPGIVIGDLLCAHRQLHKTWQALPRGSNRCCWGTRVIEQGDQSLSFDVHSQEDSSDLLQTAPWFPIPECRGINKGRSCQSLVFLFLASREFQFSLITWGQLDCRSQILLLISRSFSGVFVDEESLLCLQDNAYRSNEAGQPDQLWQAWLLKDGPLWREPLTVFSCY